MLLVKMNVITKNMPNDWKDLQQQVSQILQECGLETDLERSIETARGSVEIDVYAEDKTQTPYVIYLCECKRWTSSVPQTIVHAFRTVVTDYGANFGLLISSRAFQSGAYEAAKNTNMRLLNWIEFQELFVERWINNYMLPRIYREADPLIEYTEPVNSRIFRKADALEKEKQQRFITLREQYQFLAYFALHISIQSSLAASFISAPIFKRPIPELPIKKG
ncbi:unnamed protein product, partial [marine sediment metagenome]